MNPEHEPDDHGYELEDSLAEPVLRVPAQSPPQAPVERTPTRRTLSHSSADDWNEWKGLANALVSLVLRSIVAIALWGGIVWLVTTIFLQLGSSSALLRHMVSAAGGFAVGFVLTRGLADRAGFVGPVLSIVACAAVIGRVLAGTTIGSIVAGAVAFGFVANMIAASVGCLIAVIKTLMDD